jgi:hypothetical protein
VRFANHLNVIFGLTAALDRHQAHNLASSAPKLRPSIRCQLNNVGDTKFVRRHYFDHGFSSRGIFVRRRLRWPPPYAPSRQ